MSSTLTNTIHTDAPDTRARFYDPENFFAFQWPTVPRRQFLAERDKAFATVTATSEILLDISEALGTSYPATTPLLLARYLRVRSCEKINLTRRASAEVLYVLRGHGHSTGFGETINWVAGDALCFPGGGKVVHFANDDAVLFSVCNEPLLTFEDLEPPRGGHARVFPTHWHKSEMDLRFKKIIKRPDSEQATGRALQLATAAMAPTSQPIPSMNVAMNTLESRKISVTDKPTATELPQTKQCTRCLLIKPRAEFHKDNKSKDGRSTRCRSCKAERRRQQTQKKRGGDPTSIAGSIATLILEYSEAMHQKKGN